MIPREFDEANNPILSDSPCGELSCLDIKRFDEKFGELGVNENLSLHPDFTTQYDKKHLFSGDGDTDGKFELQMEEAKNSYKAALQSKTVEQFTRLYLKMLDDFGFRESSLNEETLKNRAVYIDLLNRYIIEPFLRRERAASLVEKGTDDATLCSKYCEELDAESESEQQGFEEGVVGSDRTLRFKRGQRSPLLRHNSFPSTMRFQGGVPSEYRARCKRYCTIQKDDGGSESAERKTDKETIRQTLKLKGGEMCYADVQCLSFEKDVPNNRFGGGVQGGCSACLCVENDTRKHNESTGCVKPSSSDSSSSSFSSDDSDEEEQYEKINFGVCLYEANQIRGGEKCFAHSECASKECYRSTITAPQDDEGNCQTPHGFCTFGLYQNRIEHQSSDSPHGNLPCFFNRECPADLQCLLNFESETMTGKIGLCASPTGSVPENSECRIDRECETQFCYINVGGDRQSSTSVVVIDDATGKKKDLKGICKLPVADVVGGVNSATGERERCCQDNDCRLVSGESTPHCYFKQPTKSIEGCIKTQKWNPKVGLLKMKTATEDYRGFCKASNGTIGGDPKRDRKNANHMPWDENDKNLIMNPQRSSGKTKFKKGNVQLDILMRAKKREFCDNAIHPTNCNVFWVYQDCNANEECASGVCYKVTSRRKSSDEDKEEYEEKKFGACLQHQLEQAELCWKNEECISQQCYQQEGASGDGITVEDLKTKIPTGRCLAPEETVLLGDRCYQTSECVAGGSKQNTCHQILPPKFLADFSGGDNTNSRFKAVNEGNELEELPIHIAAAIESKSEHNGDEAEQGQQENSKESEANGIFGICCDTALTPDFGCLLGMHVEEISDNVQTKEEMDRYNSEENLRKYSQDSEVQVLAQAREAEQKAFGGGYFAL
eukprot:g2702.t1